MKYAGLLRIKGLLDAYLAALVDDGDQVIAEAFAEFFGDHAEVLAVAWYQGSGLSHLTFELVGGALYVANEDRLVGTATDDTVDTQALSDFADRLWESLDVLVARQGFDRTVRVTREGFSSVPIAA